MQSQSDISKKMRDQLKILDPEISLEPGTPERKLIDVTAQAIAESNVDTFVQFYQYDVDTRVGQDLDDLIGLFGMARQAAKRASGRVTFSRGSTAPAPILIPAGTQVARPATAVTPQVIFQTVVDGILPEGGVSIEIPVESVAPGSSGNVPANTLTSILSNVSNISGVTNENASSGGRDDEQDSELRVRFKNTVLRNLAGTKDQLLAIAISSILTSKATILGPISKFSEYLQIDSVGEAVSNNPYAKYVYDYDYFLSTNGDETSDVYYPNVDFFFSINVDNQAEIVVAPVLFTSPTVAPTPVATSDQGNIVGSVQWAYTFVYEYVASDGTEVLGESTLSPASEIIVIETPTKVQVTIPVGGGSVVERRIYRFVDGFWRQVGEITNNVDTAFLDNNISLGDEPPKANLVEGEIAYFEHSYISKNSRNLIDEDNDIYILNKVDLYISGEDIVAAKDVVLGPATTGPNTTTFNNTPTSKFYAQNFVRDFDGSTPQIGDSFLELIWTPIATIPESLTIGNATYVVNQDYFLVRDITNLRSSFRCRDGIEMRSSMATAVAGSRFVIDYSFNRLPLVINQIAEEHKQTTQDVLVHSANVRYFNVNLVVMYETGVLKSVIDDKMSTTLTEFFNSQPFGTVIQLSDILAAAHSVSGVDNVRIATNSDHPTNYGIQEVNSNGDILDSNPFVSDFIVEDIDLVSFNALGPTDAGPIQRTQNTWTQGF
jgi:uncharacterized phage protein gp47/JayE